MRAFPQPLRFGSFFEIDSFPMKVGGSVGKEKISKITGSSPRSCLHLQLDINKIDFANAGGASRRFGQPLVHLIIRGTYINYVCFVD